MEAGEGKERSCCRINEEGGKNRKNTTAHKGKRRLRGFYTELRQWEVRSQEKAEKEDEGKRSAQTLDCGVEKLQSSTQAPFIPNAVSATNT